MLAPKRQYIIPRRSSTASKNALSNSKLGNDKLPMPPAKNDTRVTTDIQKSSASNWSSYNSTGTTTRAAEQKKKLSSQFVGAESSQRFGSSSCTVSNATALRPNSKIHQTAADVKSHQILNDNALQTKNSIALQAASFCARQATNPTGTARHTTNRSALHTAYGNASQTLNGSALQTNASIVQPSNDSNLLQTNTIGSLTSSCGGSHQTSNAESLQAWNSADGEEDMEVDDCMMVLQQVQECRAKLSQSGS